MTAVETAFNWSELEDIVNPDDPAWSGGKIVVGVFFSILTEQYKDMMDSVHCAREAAKEEKRLVSGDPVPYPSVFPNALIVWNLTTAEVSNPCETFHCTNTFWSRRHINTVTALVENHGTG